MDVADGRVWTGCFLTSTQTCVGLGFGGCLGFLTNNLRILKADLKLKIDKDYKIFLILNKVVKSTRKITTSIIAYK
jgi:hypothetical protein